MIEKSSKSVPLQSDTGSLYFARDDKVFRQLLDVFVLLRQATAPQPHAQFHRADLVAPSLSAATKFANLI